MAGSVAWSSDCGALRFLDLRRPSGIDYGHRGTHAATVAGKQLTQVFFGKPARYAYFSGCSNGGRQALMEAQRAPEDYDGIVAGDPSFGALGYVRRALNYQFMLASADRVLPPAKLDVVSKAVLAACDDSPTTLRRAIAYYNEVVAANGGKRRADDFTRLFLAPGMHHCRGGPGPDDFDTLTALEQWVEKGAAPQQLVASHSSAEKGTGTRLLCPEPLVPRYSGKGSTSVAENFSCGAPLKR